MAKKKDNTMMIMLLGLGAVAVYFLTRPSITNPAAASTNPLNLSQLRQGVQPAVLPASSDISDALTNLISRPAVQAPAVMAPAVMPNKPMMLTLPNNDTASNYYDEQFI